MLNKRAQNSINTWRCEESKVERWSTKVCRELLGLGRPTHCQPHLCPKRKERLERHRLSCPAKAFDGEEGDILNVHSPVAHSKDQSSSTARKIWKENVGVSTRRTQSPLKKKSTIHSTQTNLNFTDFFPEFENCPEMQSAETNVTFTGQPTQTDEEHNRVDDFIPVRLDKHSQHIKDPIKKLNETHKSPSKDEYREQLNKEIQEFFHEIPVFSVTTERIKHKRLYIINDFVEKVTDLFMFINNDDYNDKMEREIEECIRVLPMWEPQAEQDKIVFKNCLGESLFTLINAFNDKWHSYQINPYENPFYLNNNKNEEVKKDVTNWMQKNLTAARNNGAITNKLINKMRPILKSEIIEKLVMKAEIVHILDELSPYLQLLENKDVYVNMLANDLTNLISNSDSKCDFSKKYNFKKDLLNDKQFNNNTKDETVRQITEIIFGNDDLDLHGNKRNAVKDVCRILKTLDDFTSSELCVLGKTAISNIRDCFSEVPYTNKCENNHSSSFLVLTSEQDLSDKSGPPFHSTPSNFVRKREIPRLNKAEKLFIEKVSAIIRSWLDTTDVTFETVEEQMFKDTVVNDMTNDVHTLVKQIVQLQIPEVRIDEELLNSVIIKGITRHDLFITHMTAESPQVIDLRQRIMALDTDDLIDRSAFLEPQHGNRQTMANVKFRNITDATNEPELYYQPKALDILEDNISVWMNEQPSDIYKTYDKPARTKLMREVSANIQTKMIKKMPEDEIKNELKQWLNKIVKPQMWRNIDALTENLKNRIIKLPQDDTLTRAHVKKMNDKKETPVSFKEPEQHSYKYTEADDKLNEFIDIYIHHYKIDDDVVNGVLKLMLKRELYKCSPSTREELYRDCPKDMFNTDDKFRIELQIAKEVHGWLKNIPFYYTLLKPGSEVIEFVHSLAKNIADIEIERISFPNRINYSSRLHTEIATFMLQKDAAIANEEDKLKIDHHVGQLCLRIANLREHEEKTDELYKIVTEHMKKYDCILEKDYLKKILWHRRLADGVKKLLLGKPSASRADVEKALEIIPLPRDESVTKYKIEIKYNITIHDWLHSLPLIPPKNNDEEHGRKVKVQELLQRIIETDERKVDNLLNTQTDDDLDNYIAYWISQLPFDNTENVNVPVLISQLRSGLEYVKWTEIQPQRQSEINGQGSSRSRRHSKPHDLKQKDPGEQMVEAIENWCSNLPIQGDSDESATALKEKIATNIFQIIGSLNDDPQIVKNNQKLRNILGDKIKNLLQNLSEQQSVTENKVILTTALTDKIMEIKNLIRDITAGDDYVQALEDSIDTSLTNPLYRSPKYNPVYELFKKRIVMLWLLENYDYAVDFHSLKYKNVLSEEVRLLSEEVQKINIFATDTDEMMNDVIGAFYAANPPDEDAIIDEIETVKLRCEIEIWANELPLKDCLSYNKMLERDQILTILSKRLFDIERSGDTDENMRMEIVKWSNKLPLISGEKNNVTKYADLLMCLLKASVDSRKCQRQAEPKNSTVVEETLSKLKSDEMGVSKASKGNTSPVAGPSKARTCGGGCGASSEQLTFLIYNAIHNWCAQLPLQYGVVDEHNVVHGMKEFIAQRLMRFVSELHYRPNTLNNEGLYEHYLNMEIERIFTQLATDRAYWEEQRAKNYRKYQLVSALKAIRPLIQEANDRERYTEKLKHTISSFNESITPHLKFSKSTQNGILDDYIQYKDHKGDFENQEFYKLKINDALNNELHDQGIDPLLTANRLICELSKVESPTHSKNDVAHTTRRRHSEPQPTGLNRLPSTPALRRHTLPYFLHSSCPKFGPSQIPPHYAQKMMVPRPYPYPRKYSAPLSTSLPAPQLQRVPDFQQSLPLSQRAVPSAPLELPPVHYPASALNIQPFPLPPPVFNQTSDSLTSQSPMSQGPRTFYRRPENHLSVQPEFPQSFTGQEQVVEQRSPSEENEARVRTTARGRKSLTMECPLERQAYRERNSAEQGFCETCDRDDDCNYQMPPYRKDYMREYF